MQRPLVIFLICLALGAAIGAGIGWFAPIQDVGTGFDKFNADYQADYTVMVGAAYAVDNDWDAAQSKLGLLGKPDIAGYVVSLTERAITEGRSPDDIRNLVRLSVRFGYVTAAMQPYLPEGGAP